jgi:hypothetical protein
VRSRTAWVGSRRPLVVLVSRIQHQSPLFNLSQAQL